jgi:hypothetical protein
MSSGGAIEASIGWMAAGGNAQNLALHRMAAQLQRRVIRRSLEAAIGELNVSAVSKWANHQVKRALSVTAGSGLVVVQFDGTFLAFLGENECRCNS